ncbi:hypothetical protein GCM10022393_38020 [Aquimarina addita]|uniref:Uncharacterized protein n=1 Tax=Aquimarina addita TaxID=870485 RepID=A0ABP6US04_9FLAO
MALKQTHQVLLSIATIIKGWLSGRIGFMSQMGAIISGILFFGGLLSGGGIRF